MREGQAVTVHYDPLLAKLIVHADSRDAALAGTVAALKRYEILGVRHNIAFLVALLERPEVAAHDVHTRFIEAHLDELTTAGYRGREAAAAVAALVATRGPVAATGGDDSSARADPWQVLGPVAW